MTNHKYNLCSGKPFFENVSIYLKSLVVKYRCFSPLVGSDRSRQTKGVKRSEKIILEVIRSQNE
jgi:hypothetical protein